MGRRNEVYVHKESIADAKKRNKDGISVNVARVEKELGPPALLEIESTAYPVLTLKEQRATHSA
jgi:hypothetical protein